MWKLNSNGTFAENKELNTTLRCVYCTDGLIRVKVKYKTIGTFTEMTDAKNFLADTVKEWNEADGDA